MAEMIFALRGVPEEEAQAIRELLNRENIGWYETSAGNWGISNHAIWLNDAEDIPKARNCIDLYQKTLSEQAAKDEPLDWWSHLKNKPIAIILAIVGITIITYFSISPFFSLISSD